MDSLRLAEKAIQEHANVYEVMAHVRNAMIEAGADDADVNACLDGVINSGDYENALALSRSELRKIAG